MLVREALLIGLIFCTAIAVIFYRHENRLLFAELQQIEHQRDKYYVDWTRLLLEIGALSNHAQIDNVAHEKLNMHAPTGSEILYLAHEKKN